jgi:hypothetical protein
MPQQVPRVWAFTMFNNNCVRADGDCSACDAWDNDLETCTQDEDLGGTGHGDDSLSDADSGQ